MKRIKTKITGFDNLLEGGFPENSSILLTGKPGTGKTIFSLQYLINGVKENEVGVYFSFEEKKGDLIKQAKQFNWDILSLEETKKMKIISIGFENISVNIINDIFEIINELKAKRVVIDSISTLAFLTSSLSSNSNVNEHYIKTFLYSFMSKFKELKDTQVLFIGQKEEEISNKIASYFCDGIISINYEPMGGEFSRILTIPKMRRTKNDEDLHPMEISDCGIIIHNIE